MIPGRRQRLNASTSWQEPRRLVPGLLLLIALALLAGYALRLHRIGVKEVWWDEAHSWWYAAMPLIQGIREGMAAWHGAAGDPLFTIVLHSWITLVGDSALAMRTLSTIFNLLTIAYLSRITARTFGWKAGAIAVLIGVIAPGWVFYSQEVRQYSLTPLLMLIIVDAITGLAGVGKPVPPAAADAASAPLAREADRGVRGSGSAMGGEAANSGLKPTVWTAGGEITPWIKLVTGEVLALYTHSFMAFGMVGVNLLLAWIGVRAFLKDRSAGLRWLRNWVISQAAAAILLIPSYRNYLLRAQAGHNPFTQKLALPDILKAQWGFFTGIPWERVTNDPVLWGLSIALLVLMVPGLVVGISRYRNRQFAYQLWLVVGITVSTIAYWVTNPVFHPRYLIYLTGPFMIVLAVIMVWTWSQKGWGPPVSGLMGLVLVAISAMNLNYQYRGQLWGYRHDQPGSVAQVLRQQFDANDGIISIDGNDFALEYYGVGEAELLRAGLYEGISTPADLMEFLEGKDRIGLVSFHAQRSDTRNLLPFYLERYGSLVEEQSLDGYVIATYQMDQGDQPRLVDLKPSDLDWGGLHTTGISIETGDAVTVAVAFEAQSPSATRYAAIVSLVDPETNWTLAATTNLLYDDIGYPTSEWEPGQKAIQYYVLPLWPGTPPIEAEVQITLVDSEAGQAVDLRNAGGAPAGQRGVLGVVTPGPAPDNWAYGDQSPFAWQAVSSDVLLAYATDWPTTAPGGSVGLTLNWNLPADQLSGAVFELVQGDTLLAHQESSALQGRPLAATQPWLDRWVLQVGGEAANGPADLIVQLGDERVVLGTIDVLGFQRLTERPPIDTALEATFGEGIRLLGYRLDVPEPLTADSTLNLTLYWEALSDGSADGDYTVFTQILNMEGQLVGQHDGVPVFGTRPVSGWLAGEYLIDEHPMTFKEPYTGPIQVQIGLYDPVTFERLLTQDGQDAVLLPIELEVQ